MSFEVFFEFLNIYRFFDMLYVHDFTVMQESTSIVCGRGFYDWWN